MMGAAAQTLFDFEFGLSSYMRLEINMPLFAARRTVLSAAAAAALLVLTGCSKSDDAKSSASSADTLEKPTLVVGMELAYPPFEGKDEQGKGYDPRKLLAPGFEAIKATVKEKMEIFGSIDKA